MSQPLEKAPLAEEESTEIRCEEKSRGGMSYEMILADPIADKPEQTSSPRPKSVTVEDIDMKLLQAEERRKSVEASRLANINERLNRLEEAGRKRESANLAFIASTQVALEDKLCTFSSNREAHLNSLKAKISEHLAGVEAVRKQLEAQSEELREAINFKLNSAQENRDEHIRKLMDKLKEHDDYAQHVRLGHQEAIRQLDEKITQKLNSAESNRNTEMKKKLEQLKERSLRVNEVQEALSRREAEAQELKEKMTAAYEDRLKKINEEREAKRQAQNVSAKIDQVKEAKLKETERLKKEFEDKLKIKLESAELNRAIYLEEKIKKAKEESDRKAELVRANRERLLAEEKQETASSG